MKLKELQLLICSELNIIDGKTKYYDVCKLGGLFYNLRDKEVIGIRSIDGVLTISIK